MKRAIIAVLAIAVLSAPAAIAREDDFDFAQKLVERKFYDLAKEQFEKIVNDKGRSADERANGELGLALLLSAQARDEAAITKSDTDHVIELFKQAEDRFDQFLRTNANHPKRVDAKFEVGSLLQALGQFLNGRIETEPDRADELKKVAEEAFDQAIDLFSQVAEALEDSEDPQSDWYWRRACFSHAILHYYKGLLYEEGGAERQGVLDRATKLLNDFVWENEDNILGGYAYLFWGLTMQALGDSDAAIEYLSVAASNYPVPDPKTSYRDYMVWSKLFLDSYFKLFELCNQLGRTEERDYREVAVEKAKEMIDRVPDVWERKMGHFALLEYAKALQGLKKPREALQIATRVSEVGGRLAASTEWGAATEFLANRLINDIISDPTVDITLPPGDLLRAATGRKASREWTQAIRNFQNVITACQTPEETEEYALAAWMDIGECYYRAGKYLEAYFTYDHVEQSFPGTETAGEAAYYRYRAATARHDQTKDPRDEEMKKEARRKFATKYKDHPRAKDLQYYEGADYIADADSMKYVDDEKNVSTDPERLANRLQAKAISTYYTALSQAKQEKFDAALATLEGYEEKYADENVKNFHIPVVFERARTLIQLGRLEEAEAQFEVLKADEPTSNRTELTSGLLARAYAKRATEYKEGSPEWRAALTKAAEYAEFTLTLQKKVTWDDYQRIGNWYHKLQMWEKAQINLEKAMTMLTEIIDALPEGNEERVKLEGAQEGLIVLISEILLAQGKFAEAKKYYEDLLIPDKSARERVMQLLKIESHTEASLKELMSKIRPIPSLMEGYAKILKEIAADQQEMGIAINLVKLLIKAGSTEKKTVDAQGNEKIIGGRYSDDWWRWNLLLCQLYYEFGITFQSNAALENVKKLVDSWETVGVLDNSIYKDELLKLRQKAMQDMK